MLTLTVILISLDPSCSWADLFTQDSPVDQLSKSRRANHGPSLQKEKINSQFVWCNRSSGIQCIGMLLIPHTQPLLKFLQLKYVIHIFKKRRRAYFYHFQYPLKYTAHKLHKQQLYSSFPSITCSSRMKSIFFMYISMSVLLLHFTRTKKICPVCCASCMTGVWRESQNDLICACSSKSTYTVSTSGGGELCSAKPQTDRAHLQSSMVLLLEYLRTTLVHPCLVLMSRKMAPSMVTHISSPALPLHPRQTRYQARG